MFVDGGMVPLYEGKLEFNGFDDVVVEILMFVGLMVQKKTPKQ